MHVNKHSQPKPVLFPVGRNIMLTSKFILFPHWKKWYREHHNVNSFIRFERDQHFPLSVEQLVLSCWIDQWDAVDINSLGDIPLAIWCLLNSDLPEDVQLKKAKILLHRGEIHVAVGILLRLGLVKEAVNIYMVEGHLFDALLLNELKFSKGDDSQEVPMADLEKAIHILPAYPQIRATYQQQLKPSSHLNKNLRTTEKSRTLTPIIKDYKNPWEIKVLETIKED